MIFNDYLLSPKALESITVFYCESHGPLEKIIKTRGMALLYWYLFSWVSITDLPE
jgi:hypothetical protein